jgi:hypothetical protein
MPILLRQLEVLPVKFNPPSLPQTTSAVNLITAPTKSAATQLGLAIMHRVLQIAAKAIIDDGPYRWEASASGELIPIETA